MSSLNLKALDEKFRGKARTHEKNLIRKAKEQGFKPQRDKSLLIKKFSKKGDDYRVILNLTGRKPKLYAKKGRVGQGIHPIDLNKLYRFNEVNLGELRKHIKAIKGFWDNQGSNNTTLDAFDSCGG